MHSEDQVQNFTAKSFYFSCWLFLRLLGLSYFFAFLSIHQQILGLIGSEGILPLQDTLQKFQHNAGAAAFLTHPSLFWLNCSDVALESLAAAGILISILAILGICTLPALITLWIFYVSLSNAADMFFQFQWDILLLETGFLAIFLTSSWRLIETPQALPAYSRWALGLLRWVLFRLMFCSGVVKLFCDPHWRDLTALYYHYETQPLPNAIAWYAYQLPHWFQQISAAAVLIIELAIPFFIFATRGFRLTAAGVWCFFQGLIFLTGNYGFFNLLSAALAVLLVDDAAFARLLSAIFKLRFNTELKEKVSAVTARIAPHMVYKQKIKTGLLSTAVALVVLLSIVQFWQKWRGTYDFPEIPVVPKILKTVIVALSPYHIIGNYGLFWVVNRVRPELVLQGSNDLQEWKTYEFKYKPGELQCAPPCVGLFLPRLDWWMTFAAYGQKHNRRWFKHFIDRLFEGSPTVLALLANNPFPSRPPVYIRANLYTYHFTDYLERQDTGNWWKRSTINTWFYSRKTFRF